MIEVEALDHNGRGIAKKDNKVIFIENALPGEIVDIKIINDKKRYIDAKATKIIKKSKKRIDSPCPYFGICGGCDIMHLSYEDQLLFKQDKINNIVNKFINDKIKINKIIASSNQFNYRNKATFQIDNKLGFYKKKSNDIISIDNCLISNTLINKSIKYLKNLDLSKISKITCRTANNKLMVIIDTEDLNLNIDCIKEISDSIYFKMNEKYIHKYGDETLIEKLEKYNYIISPDSFFQTNIDVCLKLYNKIKEYVGTNKKVLDLYCGTGSIGIFVNNKNDVIGIEINNYAVADANKNKEINKISNIKFICGDSGKIVDKLIFKPNLVIVDPPRSGLNNETLLNILKFNCNEIIYVSCDPMTMVRDLNYFKKYYDIIEITPFDMFPNTKHVECICYLKKNARM